MTMKRLKRSMALSAVLAMLVGGTAMAQDISEDLNVTGNVTAEKFNGIKFEKGNGNNSIVIGAGEATGNKSLAIGFTSALKAKANGDNSIAIGNLAKASKDDAIAIGNGADATAEDSVAIGANAKADRPDTVSFGQTNHEKELVHVAEGTSDTSAVNKKQMDTALAKKADKATTLAGYGITDAYTKTEVDTALATKANAADVYTKTEVDTALTAKADKSTVDTLSAKVDTNTTAIGTNTSNIEEMKAVDTELGNRINKNITDITANATAITANTQAIANNTNAIAGLNQSVTRLDGRLDKVGAGAAALAALHPLDYDAENKLSFAAGMGNYGGETAGAVGAFYRPNEDVMFSIGGTAGNGENMVNLGVSFAIGKGSSGLASMSKAALVDKVQQMESEMEELKALVAQLMAEKKG